MARTRVLWLRLLGARGIHPKCLCGHGVRMPRGWAVSIGQRCVLEPDVWLSAVNDEARIVMGEYTFVGRGSEVSASLRVEIGRGCLIGPRVYITDHNHSVLPGQPMFEQPCIAKPIRIGDDVWLGAHCVVLPGVTIGDGAVVGAGAVVTRDVAARDIVGGVPARVIATRPLADANPTMSKPPSAA